MYYKSYNELNYFLNAVKWSQVETEQHTSHTFPEELTRAGGSPLGSLGVLQSATALLTHTHHYAKRISNAPFKVLYYLGAIYSIKGLGWPYYQKNKSPVTGGDWHI